MTSQYSNNENNKSELGANGAERTGGLEAVSTPDAFEQSEKPSTGQAHYGHTSVQVDPDNPDQVIIRTRKKQRKKSHKKKRRMHPALRVALVILSVLVAVAAAAGIALAIAVNQGNVSLHKVLSGNETITEAQDVNPRDNAQVVEYKGHTYKYNENIASVLVIGHDNEKDPVRPDASLADTIVLLTIDTQTNKVRATVVPRNTWCDVDLYDEEGNYAGTNKMQVTLSHGVTLPTAQECAANTVKSVSRIFYNMPIEYYVDFGGEVVAQATRAVGGVQLVALESIPGANYQAGDEVILEGDSAFQYVQYREVDKDESALDRQQRQVQFLQAFASKVSGMGVQGIMSVYNSVSDDLVSNLGASEIAYLASCFATGDNAQLDVVQLTGKTQVGRESDGIEYERYMLDEESVMQCTLDAFYTQID